MSDVTLATLPAEPALQPAQVQRAASTRGTDLDARHLENLPDG